MRLLLLVAMTGALQAQTPNYEDDVKPIFRRYCFGCHSAGESRSGLNLEAYEGVMRGGSSGDAVRPGRASGSLLYQAVAHEGDGVPRMPQGGGKIPDGAIATIREWIQGGVLETAKSKPRGVPAVSAAFAGSLLNKPQAVALPGALAALPKVELKRPHPVTALAVSPWAPVVAVAGHERVGLLEMKTGKLLGELPFPEGVPFVIRFSRDGAKLLVAGGKSVQAGRVAIIDVKTGARLATLGAERDVVLAADLSADGKLVALGGPGKVVRVLRVEDGEEVYKIAKHTDWVTALEFSPDGAKLATGDRSGGLYLWEAENGSPLVTLAEHKDSIASLSWRGDGALLASGSEDGKLVIWNAMDGFPMATIQNAHTPKPPPGTFGKLPNGVLSVQFLMDGRVLSVGRDRMMKVWGVDGKQKAASKVFDVMLTKVAASGDAKVFVAGDVAGHLVYWDGK